MLLVKNAKVYAPEYLGVKDILIAGGRIERIADHLPEYEGCEVIDGTGKIVTPGIIDRQDRKSTRLNSSHRLESRMPSSA